MPITVVSKGRKDGHNTSRPAGHGRKMPSTETISQTLTEVPKADLVAGQRYLMVDDAHAILVYVSNIDGRKFASVELSYLATRVQMTTDILLDHFTTSLAKFFKLPV